MFDSILDTIKKMLGIDPSYTVFDLDIISHINSTFFTLSQIGIGPRDGFSICDSRARWVDYIGADSGLEAIKTYIYLRVKDLFDPSSSSVVSDSYHRSIKELEWRLKVEAERGSLDSKEEMRD